MDFDVKKQRQTAGDNSIQNQGQGNVNITHVNNYYGAPPTDIVSIAATVYDQIATQAMKEYTEAALTTVKDRILAFGYDLFPRLNKIKGAMELFKDPKFQFWLRDAQITAAKTNRPEDLCILSELLSCHILKGHDMKVDAGIHQAIKIVDEIDNDALCGLTVACAFQYVVPNKGMIQDGLKDLDNSFMKLIYMDLPEGMNWLDHVDMLGALRLSSLGFIDSREYLASQMEGYVCVGIKNNSIELDRAYSILDENKISRSVLVDNECLEGFKRLNIRSLDNINPKYKDVVNRVRSLYSNDKTYLNKARNRFIELWDSFDALRTVRSWWSRIPHSYSVSYMGRVLAQTNAKRIDSKFPDLIF